MKLSYAKIMVTLILLSATTAHSQNRCASTFLPSEPVVDSMQMGREQFVEYSGYMTEKQFAAYFEQKSAEMQNQKKSEFLSSAKKAIGNLGKPQIEKLNFIFDPNIDESTRAQIKGALADAVDTDLNDMKQKPMAKIFSTNKPVGVRVLSRDQVKFVGKHFMGFEQSRDNDAYEMGLLNSRNSAIARVLYKFTFRDGQTFYSNNLPNSTTIVDTYETGVGISSSKEVYQGISYNEWLRQWKRAANAGREHGGIAHIEKMVTANFPIVQLAQTRGMTYSLKNVIDDHNFSDARDEANSLSQVRAGYSLSIVTLNGITITERLR